MPTYKYECDGCGAQALEMMTIAEHDVHKASVPLHTLWDERLGSTHCGFWKQVYEFQIKKSMPEHYSDTLDSVVTSERDFVEQLKIKAAEDTIRNGFEVNYELVDPTDPEAAGVKGDAGFESQERAHYDGNFDGHRSIFT